MFLIFALMQLFSIVSFALVTWWIISRMNKKLKDELKDDLSTMYEKLKDELKNEVSTMNEKLKDELKNEVSTMKENLKDDLNASLVKLFNERSSFEDDESSDATTVSTTSMQPIDASKIKKDEAMALLLKLGLNLIDMGSSLGPQPKAVREVFW